MSSIDETQFTTKTRKRVFGTGYKPSSSYVSYQDPSREPIFSSAEGPEMCDAQITVSEGHPLWSVLQDYKGSIKPDVGGDFLTTRWSSIIDKTVYIASYKDWYDRIWECEGPFIPSIHSAYGTAFEGWGYITADTDLTALAAKFPAVSHSDAELLAFGTSAIARTRPDISPANVTQFLVELKRDGIPFKQKLSRERLREILKKFSREDAKVARHSVKDGSDLFLENTFGLAPMVSDLKSFVEVAVKGNSVLDNLLANNGKTIRRRYHFPDEDLSTTVGGRAGAEQFGFLNQYQFSNQHYFENGGDFHRPIYSYFWDVNTNRKVWFSGAYRVYMPPDMEPVSRLRSVVDHLRWDYGVELNISTMWNLAPWSWLIDWELNLGDLITNLSKWSSDALLLQYGYVMENTKSTYIVSPQSGQRWENALGAQEPNTTLAGMGIRVHRKRRIRATPYGFGLTYGELSANQKAILAAIGITRF